MTQLKFVSIITVIIQFLLACEQNSKHQHTATETYTCSMHPQVISDKAGTCPVCGMDLVLKATANSPNPNDLMLSDSQIKLANITTQKVTSQPIGQTVVVNGRIVENKKLSKVVSSRTAGRIEKLYVKETGRTITKGEPLYEIYSETLLTLQKEFFLTKEQFETLGSSEKRYKSFLDASKRKLLLIGLSEHQIEKLGQSKKVQNTITLLSPVTGIVSEISATEGQYVSEGMTLMRIEDIGTVWIEAELYPSETSLVTIGDKINIKITGYDNDLIDATVSFLSPEYRTGSQVTIMRAAISNPDLKFKPGMQAQVFFTHSTKSALALPTDAVIRDGNGSHVYVQRGQNTFRAQIVKTGLEDFEKIEIIEGLTEADTVVVSGAYLLYSEIVLKKGADPMALHNH